MFLALLIDRFYFDKQVKNPIVSCLVLSCVFHEISRVCVLKHYLLENASLL